MTRILFLFDRPLGFKCLRYLVGKGANICGAVSQPDGGMNWWGVPKHGPFLRENRIKWFDHSDDLRGTVKATRPDVVISVLFNKIVPGSIVNNVPSYNLHCAPLPEYKGYNSTLWAIINGDKRFGATLHVMTEEPDAGGIIGKEMFDVPRDVTNTELYKIAHAAAFRIFRLCIPRILEGKAVPRPQSGRGRFYRRNQLPSREVKLSWPGERIERYTRAFYFPPFEPCYIIAAKKKIHLLPSNINKRRP